MKVERESLLGTLAVLGLALAVAYLGPDQDRPHPSRSQSTSDAPASADDASAPGRVGMPYRPGGFRPGVGRTFFGGPTNS